MLKNVKFGRSWDTRFTNTLKFDILLSLTERNLIVGHSARKLKCSSRALWSRIRVWRFLKSLKDCNDLFIFMEKIWKKCQRKYFVIQAGIRVKKISVGFYCQITQIYCKRLVTYKNFIPLTQRVDKHFLSNIQTYITYQKTSIQKNRTIIHLFLQFTIMK